MFSQIKISSWEQKKTQICHELTSLLHFKNFSSENTNYFYKNLKLKMHKNSKLFRKNMKKLKISQQFSRIINEEYKNANQNDLKSFISLYKQLNNVDLQEYFKEGRENPSQIPSFLINRLIYSFIGVLFFIKFLNHTLF